jgi:hypothetical protein
VENYINSLVADITAAQNVGGFVLNDQQDFSSGISVPNNDSHLYKYNKVYDLQGRRVTTPLQHGLYIIGGKKVNMR